MRLVERYDERIAGVLSCYDRIIITGTIPAFVRPTDMTSWLDRIAMGFWLTFVYTNADCVG